MRLATRWNAPRKFWKPTVNSQSTTLPAVCAKRPKYPICHNMIWLHSRNWYHLANCKHMTLLYQDLVEGIRNRSRWSEIHEINPQRTKLVGTNKWMLIQNGAKVKTDMSERKDGEKRKFRQDLKHKQWAFFALSQIISKVTNVKGANPLLKHAQASTIVADPTILGYNIRLCEQTLFPPTKKVAKLCHSSSDELKAQATQFLP